MFLGRSWLWRTKKLRVLKIDPVVKLRVSLESTKFETYSTSDRINNEHNVITVKPVYNYYLRTLDNTYGKPAVSNGR